MQDDARLQRWLTSHRDAVAKHPSQEHFDVDTLARHAAGQLSANKARMVNEHILACDDGRCGAFVRSQAVDVDAASELLYRASAGQAEEAEAVGVGVGVVGRGSREDPGVSQQMQRTFQSREIIWSTFESLARELDVPIDELVNDAMEAYAKVRGYPKEMIGAQPPHRVQVHHRDPLEETHDAPAISALDRSYSPPAHLAPAPAAGRDYDDDDDDLAKTAARASFPRPGRSPGSAEIREFGEESRTSPRFSRPNPVGAMPPPQRSAPPSINRPPPSRGGIPPVAPPPLPPRLMPPTTMPMMGAPHREANVVGANVGTKRLVLTYQGRTYNVEKERYLLGRSKTQADLRLDDPNVSRQHAVIERVGAAWYIVDLGSTNGVLVAGERVARRALQDGDLIVITSHEIRCALR